MINKNGPSCDNRTTNLIQRQLVVLLHAQLCQQRELRQINNNRPVTMCQLPFCSEMKDVLNHLRTCQVGTSCQYTHCKTSRGILCHWRSCTSYACPLCQPIRQAREDSTMPNIGKLSLS